MAIARVFPRRTKATPVDELSFCDVPPFFTEGITAVHVSVCFTWDIPRGEYLAKQWESVAPVKIGGPAFNQPGGEFQPGMYLKEGYTITSRGCPNKCWFCSVPKREKGLRELEIKEGNNILDDNLLACSDGHIIKVFEMLEKQSKVEFTGGLEAKALKEWHIPYLARIKPSQMFFAYDGPEDKDDILKASVMLRDFRRDQLRCYVLIGYPKDNLENAEERLKWIWSLGFMPMAMLWKNTKGDTDPNWKPLQRQWARPAIIKSMMNEV